MHCGGIFHASDSLLHKIHETQQRFLRELGITEEEAFLQHNFAPSQLRRNIGILGLMHKRVIGECHPIFRKLLPFCTDVGQPGYPNGHNKQLYGHLHTVRLQMAWYCRSIFAMIYRYNMLPQNVVDSSTVKEFQKHLTLTARMHCAAGTPEWQELFSRR